MGWKRWVACWCATGQGDRQRNIWPIMGLGVQISPTESGRREWLHRPAWGHPPACKSCSKPARAPEQRIGWGFRNGWPLLTIKCIIICSARVWGRWEFQRGCGSTHRQPQRGCGAVGSASDPVPKVGGSIPPAPAFRTLAGRVSPPRPEAAWNKRAGRTRKHPKQCKAGGSCGRISKLDCPTPGAVHC